MIQQISPQAIIGIIVGYFLLLIIISFFTGRDSGNHQFFIGAKKSPWFIVAFGMIGASLSGVTFISIPGVVGAGGTNMAFSYMQMVFGYLVGYLFIAGVLLPLYYSRNLTSIYGYLESRFGFFSYKSGAGFFLLSRVTQAAFRLFLVAIVLQKFVMDAYNLPFELTVVITILLIWVYTFRGGIRTIVWTDTLQTLCMLIAVVCAIFAIGNALEFNLNEMIQAVHAAGYDKIFFFEGGWSDPNNFFKQFLSGALICIVMTGLDQDMMQKNLSCKTLKESQKNMITFSVVLVFVNIIFLFLGALLYIYAANLGLDIPDKTDQLFPTIALNYLTPAIGIIFVLGLIAAAYSSADSALTSLTTSFCIDFLNFEKKQDDHDPAKLKRIRFLVHLGFSVLLFTVIVIFNLINDDSVINNLFKWAGFTYGPILGLFVFGMITNRRIRDQFVLPVVILAPVITLIIDMNSANWFNGLNLGFLNLALNGLLTILGLLIISYPREKSSSSF